MGSTQSSYVSKDVPVLTKPVTLMRDTADKMGGALLFTLAESVAEFDVKERLVAAHIIDRDCIGNPKPFAFDVGDFSGAQVLNMYKDVKNMSPIRIENEACFKTSTTDLIDNVLYSKVLEPPKPCMDKETLAALVVCLAVPCLCPCLACCWLVNNMDTKPKVKIGKVERAKSLMATLKSLDVYITNAPSTKGFCCYMRSMQLDKQTLRLYLGFLILDEIDSIMSEMISTMSSINAVFDVLMPMLAPEARDKLLEKLRDLREKEEKKVIPKEDEAQVKKNREFNDFLIGQRVCRDFISNDLLSYLFGSDDKTPIGNSINFIPQKVMSNDPNEVARAIMTNFNALQPGAEKFLPAAVVPIVNEISKSLEVMATTVRVKEASHVIDKNNKDERERLKGTQDLLGLRLFVGNKKIFYSFAAATLSAYSVKQLPGVANVVVSHKLQYTTGFLDFKIIVELAGEHKPFFEIQIVPSKNFIIDEAVKGHDQHKGK